jgi:hypothetical protein
VWHKPSCPVWGYISRPPGTRHHSWDTQQQPNTQAVSPEMMMIDYYDAYSQAQHMNEQYNSQVIIWQILLLMHIYSEDTEQFPGTLMMMPTTRTKRRKLPRENHHPPAKPPDTPQPSSALSGCFFLSPPHSSTFPPPFSIYSTFASENTSSATRCWPGHFSAKMTHMKRCSATMRPTSFVTSNIT